MAKSGCGVPGSTYERVLDARSRGLRMSDIAAEVGVSHQRCYQIVVKGREFRDARAFVAPDAARPSAVRSALARKRREAVALKVEAVLGPYSRTPCAYAVAEALDMSLPSVWKYLRIARLAGDPRAAKPESTAAKILTLWNAGEKAPAIAAKLGVTKNHINVTVQRARSKDLEAQRRRGARPQRNGAAGNLS